jgi:hypothetical protein
MRAKAAVIAHNRPPADCWFEPCKSPTIPIIAFFVDFMNT